MLKFNTFATFGSASKSPDLKKFDTGSCFDNILVSTRQRPGQHIDQHIISEPGAFAKFKPSSPPDPNNFLRKGTGFGGQRTLTPIDKKRLDSLKEEKVHLDGPPSSMAYARRYNPPNTDFRRFYDRGDIPVKVLHGSYRKVCWLKRIEELDYYHILPLFIDGLREEEEPYQFLAYQGAIELLIHQSSQEKILPVIPQLIIPLKSKSDLNLDALNTRDQWIMCKAIKVLKFIALSGTSVGEALVPYYRQLLPILNIFRHFDRNIGDYIDYHQQCEDNLGVLIQELLNTLEQQGGNDAFINIKYMIPTYESFMNE